MQENLLLEIKTRYEQFTKAEMKIADYVLAHVSTVIYMSITDLAEACEVGDASVYRFCRTLGLGGYQEFKMKISMSIPQNPEFLVKAEEKYIQDEILQAGQRMIEAYTDSLRETLKFLNPESVNRAAAMMLQARQVYFSGIGDTLQTALEARNKFIRLTKKVQCVTDPHIQAMTAAIMEKGDLLMIFSHSGATKDNIQVARLAKEAGAAVIAITRYEKSPLTAYADEILLCGVNEDPLQGVSTAGKMCQMFILDLLYQSYFSQCRAVSEENREKTARAVAEKLF